MKRWIWAVLGSAIFAGACQSEEPGTTDCQIRYLQLGAAPSDRVDLLIEPETQVVKRLVREDGDEDTAAIFYRFDDPEVSALLHELDSENDGTIDSIMERSDRLVDRIDLYQVDAIADDGLVDSLQVSVPLETGGDFAGWQPARMFYTIPCGPSHELVAEEDAGIVSITVDLNEDGSVDGEMRLVFRGEAVSTWTVDNNGDGIVDFRGRAEYREDGKVERVEWRDWELAPVAISTFDYDEDGRLVGFREDMNGDDVIENELEYAAVCWEGDDASP